MWLLNRNYQITSETQEIKKPLLNIKVHDTLKTKHKHKVGEKNANKNYFQKESSAKSNNSSDSSETDKQQQQAKYAKVLKADHTVRNFMKIT